MDNNWRSGGGRRQDSRFRTGRAIAAVVALLVTAAAGACVPAYSGNAVGSTMAVIGDSITDQAQGTFHARLDPTYHVSISGIGGTTIAEQLPIAQEYAATHGPEVVVIELGANDAYRALAGKTTQTAAEQKASLDRSAAALDSMVAALPSAMCVVVVNLGINVFNPAYRAWAAHWNTQELPARAIADQRVRIADWNATMVAYVSQGEPEGMLTTDTLHPTAVGQRLLADLIGDAADICLATIPSG